MIYDKTAMQTYCNMYILAKIPATVNVSGKKGTRKRIRSINYVLKVNLTNT